MRRSTRNDVGCVDNGETGISGPLEGGEHLGLSCSFSFPAWVTSHLVESDYAS
jgi:hypothetical protein